MLDLFISNIYITNLQGAFMFKIIAGLNRNGEYAENLKLNLLRAIKSSDFNLLAYVISMGGEKHFNDTHVIQAIKSSFFTPYFDSQDNYTECQDYLIAHKKTPFKEIFFQDPSLNEKDANPEELQKPLYSLIEKT